MSNIISIDFDNTIVDYSVAISELSKDLFGLNLQTDQLNKNFIKNFIIENHGLKTWTEIQGRIYSEYIKYSKPYPGFIEFLEILKNYEFTAFIVSHKTRFPIEGFPVNLIDAANAWIDDNLKSNDGSNYFPIQRRFFEPTIEKKVNRILTINPIFHIDDLEEIIAKLPKNVTGILFNSIIRHNQTSNYFDWQRISNEIKKYVK